MTAPTMRVAYIAGLVSIAGCIGIFACSSSDSATAIPDAGATSSGGTSGDDPLPGDDDDGTSGGTSSGSSGSTDGGGTSSGSSGTSSGGINHVDSGPLVDGGDAGQKCQAGSVKEVEANDAVGTAMAVPASTGTVCGRLATGTDLDFFKFTLPAAATNLTFDFDSTDPTIVIDITVEGQTFSIGRQDNGMFRFAAGKEYVLKATLSGVGTPAASQLDYRIGIAIAQP